MMLAAATVMEHSIPRLEPPTGELRCWDGEGGHRLV